MGGNSSKKATTKTNNVEKPKILIEKSTGFHMVELHIPSMGFSVVTLLIIILVGIVAFKLYLRYKKSRQRRRQQRQFTGQLMPFQNPSWRMGEGIQQLYNSQLAAAAYQQFAALPPLHPTGTGAGPTAAVSPSRRYETGRFTEVDDDVHSQPEPRASGSGSRSSSSVKIEKV